MLRGCEKNPVAIKYVKNQAEEVCLEAVKKCGYSIIYIKKQTLNICLEALRYDGTLLDYVNEGIVDKSKHYIYKNQGIKDVYVNKINGNWLFSVGCQSNMTKEDFIKRIYNDNGGLVHNPHRQIYIDFLSKFHYS